MLKNSLFASAISKFLLGVVLVGVLVFWPAGTMHYAGGWLLMGILFVPMLLAGFVMLAKAPNLLRSRLQAKESRSQQQLVVKLSGLMFIIGFILAGLDFRFGWLPLPGWVQYVAVAVFLLAYGLYAEVLRENAYLSRTIQVQEGQQVISTGLYGILRHPMYFATVLLFWAMPLVLGSLIAWVVFLPYPLLLVKRIQNEEQLLAAELPGYTAYQQKVKYRLIPFIW